MPKTVCGEAKGNSIVATRVATLTRRSLDRKHQPFSIEAQDAKLGAYIQSQDHWELAPGCRYTDDMSGATVERPGLQKALRDAKLGRYDVLLVYRIDRIARSLRGLLEVLDELERAGVAFRSVTEHFDTQSPVGRMLIQILGAFAEFERATIIDRVISGMERKAARGGWCGGTRPFGYQVDPATHFLVPDPTEAPLVAVIFDLYANQRLGARAIAMQLNAQGHRSRVGRLWGHTTVLTVLRNRAYLGEIHFRGAYHPAPHPPLVDRAVFDTAQALLQERGEAHTKRASNSSEYLLAGRVICQQCGKHFVGNAATGNRYRYRYYTCYSRLRYGTRACSSERLPAEQLDHAVLDALLATYQHSDLFERAVTAADSQAASLHEHYQGELAVITTEIGKAEAAIERYLDAFEAGTLPETQCGKRLETLAAKIADLRARQDELRELLANAQVRPPTPADLAALTQQLRATIQAGPAPARKALIGALVHEVRVTSRTAIIPVFRVPGGQPPHGKVRAMSSWVPLAGLEPATCCSGGVCPPSGLAWRVRFSQVKSGAESGWSPHVRSGYGRWNDAENDIGCKQVPSATCLMATR